MTITFLLIIVFFFILAGFFSLFPLFEQKKQTKLEPKNEEKAIKSSQEVYNKEKKTLTFKIDEKQSRIAFVGKNSLGKKEGYFKTFNIDFCVNENNLEKSTINVDIDTDSLETSNPILTKHLKSSDFFDTLHFSKATFTSLNVRKITDEIYQIKGLLTIKNISKEIQFDVHIHDEYFSLKTELNRLDFSVGKIGSGPQAIEPIVQVTISLKRI